MLHNPVVNEMQKRLENALSPTLLEIHDESADHIGHAGAALGGGHYAVVIGSENFQNKNLVQCHQMIYSALGELMQREIHALRINVRK